MIIHAVVVGEIATNCYVVGCEKTKKALIIDPGAEHEKIRRVIEKSGLKPEHIVNTHGHGDHIAANDKFGLPISIHKLDADCLVNPMRNLSAVFAAPYRSPAAARLLEEGDVLEAGTIRLEVIHTPGHTPGSICLIARDDGIVFTGDTLFADGVGRTDLPGGSEVQILKSIRTKLFTLSDEMVIYPGHGSSSTIGREKESGWV